MKSAIEQLISDNSDFMENIPESEKYDSLLEECLTLNKSNF